MSIRPYSALAADVCSRSKSYQFSGSYQVRRGDECRALRSKLEDTSQGVGVGEGEYQDLYIVFQSPKPFDAKPVQHRPQK